MKQSIREAWNSRKNQDDPYYPPDTYIYELSAEQPQLLIKLDRFLVRHIAITKIYGSARVSIFIKNRGISNKL